MGTTFLLPAPGVEGEMLRLTVARTKPGWGPAGVTAGPAVPSRDTALHGS